MSSPLVYYIATSFSYWNHAPAHSQFSYLTLQMFQLIRPHPHQNSNKLSFHLFLLSLTCHLSRSDLSNFRPISNLNVIRKFSKALRSIFFFSHFLPSKYPSFGLRLCNSLTENSIPPTFCYWSRPSGIYRIRQNFNPRNPWHVCCIWHFQPCHSTPWHYITSHHIPSHRIASHHITSHHITSHHITLHYITSHHIASHQKCWPAFSRKRYKIER